MRHSGRNCAGLDVIAKHSGHVTRSGFSEAESRLPRRDTDDRRLNHRSARRPRSANRVSYVKVGHRQPLLRERRGAVDDGHREDRSRRERLAHQTARPSRHRQRERHPLPQRSSLQAPIRPSSPRSGCEPEARSTPLQPGWLLCPTAPWWAPQRVLGLADFRRGSPCGTGIRLVRAVLPAHPPPDSVVNRLTVPFLLGCKHPHRVYSSASRGGSQHVCGRRS